jgi:anti-anti-sigma regulatory factor
VGRVVLTYAPHGVLDFRATETFRTELRQAIDASDCVVVVDFAAVTVISIGAFRALVDCGDYAIDHDCALVVWSLPRPYAGLQRLFRWDERAATADEPHARSRRGGSHPRPSERRIVPAGRRCRRRVSG